MPVRECSARKPTKTKDFSVIKKKKKLLCEGNAHPGKHTQTRILNIIFPNALIWYIFGYKNTHEKSVNAVNKRAWDVEPSFSFSICQGWGVFQQREREREREG